MSRYTREFVVKIIDKDLAQAREAAEVARRFAVDCATNNSISGSGERALAEGQSAAWETTVGKFERLRKSIGESAPIKVELGALADIEMEGDVFTAVVSEVSCQLSSDDVTVVTPESPLGKALIGRGQGESVEYQMGSMRMRARVQNVF